jgi:hypothetical protein
VRHLARVELVEVLTQQGLGALGVVAAALDEAPTARLQVHVQVDQQARGSTDHVGAWTAGGQLGEVGQVAVTEDVAHTLERLADVGARERSDASCASHGSETSQPHRQAPRRRVRDVDAPPRP